MPENRPQLRNPGPCPRRIPGGCGWTCRVRSGSSTDSRFTTSSHRRSSPWPICR